MEYSTLLAPGISSPVMPVDSEGSTIYLITGLSIFIFAVMIVAASILNLLIIPRLPDISDASKVFYNSLSVADLIFGFALLPALPSAIVGHWPLGEFLCKIFGFGVCLSPAFSASSLLLLNLDRFCSVVSPYRYAAFMNQRKSIVIVIALCAIEAAVLLLAVFVNPIGLTILNYSDLGVCIIIFTEPDFLVYSIAIFSVFIWPFIPMLSIIYTRIICISRRHVRRIQVQELSVTATYIRSMSRIDEDTVEIKTDESIKPPRRVRRHRAVRMTLFVTGSFVVAWIPFSICQIYIALGYPVCTLVRLLVTWPLLLSPLCNVAIYSATKKSYRIEARRLLTKCAGPCLFMAGLRNNIVPHDVID